jgi:TonB family protein
VAALLGSRAAFSQDAAGDAPGAELGTYLGPVPIERTAPYYPFESVRDGKEGWVDVSFIISPDGKVVEPMIEDSTGVRVFEAAALKAVKNWRYKPATLNGEPVEQSMTRTIIRFEIPGYPKAARPNLVAAYRKIQDHLNKRELDQAKALLDDLESAGRVNLYEDAWFWWLEYLYMDAAGGTSPEQQSEVLTRAIGSDDNYLLPDPLVMCTVRLFTLRVRAQQYASALSLAERLGKNKEAKKSQYYTQAVAAMDGTKREIDALVAGETTIKVDAKIGGFDYWVHGLLRRSFSITDINGELDAVEVRCSKRNARYDSVAGEHTWTIPASWGNCGAYIKGTPGTTFAFYEHPNQKLVPAQPNAK